MNMKFAAIACLAGGLACAALAETPTSNPWIGVWESKLDGQPGATLTLANDTGQLGGTLVLNIIVKDGSQPRVVASEPHVLIDPHVNGETLTFAVRPMRGDGTMQNFTVALNPDGSARIHCTNCGKGAPTVDMQKQ
jgi:hypothetical protein